MPAGSVSLLISLIILIILSGFFSATETAYSCASKIKLRTLFTNGNKRAGKVLDLAENRFDNLLSTILLGNNIVNLSASAIATILFAKLLINPAIDSAVISTAVVTVAVLIFGEITPKYIAKTYPEKIAMVFYPFIICFYYILYPFNLLLSGWQWLVGKIFGIKKDEVITEDEIMTFVEEAEEDGTLKENETKLIKSVIEFDDLEVGDIFTPRVNMTAVEIHQNLDEILKAFQTSGHSRLPVYKESIDSITGIIHIKDFYRLYTEKNGSLSDIVQEVHFTTEHTKISKLLKNLQNKRSQLAIVMDEYGGTSGIVTIEDIIEELVGEIYDEHDEKITLHRKISDSHYIFDGNAPLGNAFEVLGIDPEKAEDYDANTVSGWVIELLGEIPVNGKKFDFENFTVEVLKSTVRKVLRIQVIKNL